MTTATRPDARAARQALAQALDDMDRAGDRFDATEPGTDAERRALWKYRGAIHRWQKAYSELQTLRGVSR